MEESLKALNPAAQSDPTRDALWPLTEESLCACVSADDDFCIRDVPGHFEQVRHELTSCVCFLQLTGQFHDRPIAVLLSSSEGIRT